MSPDFSVPFVQLVQFFLTEAVARFTTAVWADGVFAPALPPRFPAIRASPRLVVAHWAHASSSSDVIGVSRLSQASNNSDGADRQFQSCSRNQLQNRTLVETGMAMESQ